jgi:glycosyltransferase involved in cell wall biosynthesis
MAGLSVVIITYNEERNIERCLRSVQGIADEIVVVDSFSTDKTEMICRQYGAKFIQHPFGGYVEQKNFALTQSSCDYILSLDADEALTEELKASIEEVKKDPKHSAYEMNRLNNYCGQWIRHCGWYPDRKVRLFEKGKGKWGGENPHDKYLPDQAADVGFLKGDLQHYSYYSIAEHIAQANKFSGIGAASAHENGARSGLLKILVKPPVRFFRDYILLLGFLDGFYGFVICRISAHATFLKYVKLRELSRKERSIK